MKRLISLTAALLIAAALSGCANMASDVERTYDRMVPDHTTADTYRGNVSTTNDGRVNGTNPTTRTDRTGRTATHPVKKPVNTDAMGAGMAG